MVNPTATSKHKQKHTQQVGAQAHVKCVYVCVFLRARAVWVYIIYEQQKVRARAVCKSRMECLFIVALKKSRRWGVWFLFYTYMYN